ncbi:MAG TPA: hypothetical protein VMW16_00025 [Sedimentisphaerales bacterium]|nr:hypothetical protein [Sedimentisphaerales bacterium]
MTHDEVATILNDFGKVWPRVNDETINRGLYRRLRLFDFHAMRNAFDTVISEGVPRYYLQTPWAAVIVKAKETGGLVHFGAESEPALLFYVACVQHPQERMLRWRTPFYSASPTDTPWRDIEAGQAEKARLHAEETYGGAWVIERPKEKQHYADDGLRGKAAREQAEKNILAGPDYAARRWLQARLAPKPFKPKLMPPKEPLAKLSFHKQQQAQAAKYQPEKLIDTNDEIPF